MTGVSRHFYTGGNTAHGFTSMLDSSLQGLDRVVVLRGGVGTGKLINMEQIGNQLSETGHEIWFIHCASDPHSLDGLIIPELKVAIIDTTAPHVIVPTRLNVDVQYVELDEACRSDQLLTQQSDIARLNDSITQAFGRAYSGFSEALRIHDEWEQLYISNMDFLGADLLCGEYISVLFGSSKLEKKSRVDHRFLGAATPDGAIDYVPNLTEGLKRYLLKGRPGSGKSTLLKKLANTAIERGLNVEIYHCGFDPNSLDMIIVRELGFAIFDSTAPHEYNPDRPSDEIVDMYERCINSDTDETYAEQISKVKAQYTSAMKQSISELAHTRSLLDELEQIYLKAMNSSIIERIKHELLKELQIT
ncbi:MAG: PRK06851 family protein [Candidatus Cohnella colombiensis]|uniref:PRK06851 family protein n=1 Tax=Candidatus Cohnella colombiensis TaxID=3121368 RepID=A0AA95JFA7_9BACL|nr:MAG: PRK06851 family protein [Cohnella sp.]